jgi:predicted NBD/HSP70 family sugar kinase
VSTSSFSSPRDARARPRAMGNNLDSVRQHNLSTILTLVHHAGSIPRAQLTRRTGLNRSTIAALVGELVDLRLVTESSGQTTSQVGRPSSVVQTNPDTVAIAVNPEVDAVTVGVVGLGGVVQNRIRFPTEKPPTVREAVNITSAIIAGIQGGLQTETRIVGIGIAVPGLVSMSNGLVRLAPHLGWKDEPLTEMLADATGYPTSAGNDASLGARAERTFGAGRGIDDMIYLNGGASGVGGGVISSGVALGGTSGYAGELGHTRVRSDGRADSAGVRGTFESEVTRSALLEVLGLASADTDELEQSLFAAKSLAVRSEVNRQLDFLGIALGGAINILNPRLIILGGFLGSLYALDPERLHKVVAREALPASWNDVTISRPMLRADLLMVGAAELAFSPLLADPAGVSAQEQEGRPTNPPKGQRGRP